MQENTGYYNPLQQTAPETGQIIDTETGNMIGHADCGAVSEDDAMEKYFCNRCDYLEDGTYNFCSMCYRYETCEKEFKKNQK